MKFLYLGFQKLRLREGLQDKEGNFIMEQIMEEYGNALLALSTGGIMIGLFLKVLETVTAF